jgi:hypothetical protein
MSAQSIRAGDLVKMNQGYSVPGIVLEIFTLGSMARWATILWTDGHRGSEKVRDLKLLSDRVEI